MQNAGQYVPGTANAHQTQQFVPSEPSPNGGSTTSSLRQFRKREVDKTQSDQSPKQESHVARVAPHNHYPPASNDLYRYPSHQFPDYSHQVKYSDIADPAQPNPISTSVIQKPKSKDYMEMCNVQQQHLNNQQQYSPENGQYMHRDPTQGYPTGFKPEAHYLLPKDQHQYQQLALHSGQPKFNPMPMGPQNMRKYNPAPADNPFLNKLSKIHPSMARSIISDHHLQEPQPSYPSPMDQRGMYSQQNHRYYTSSLHQPNPYAPNPNYPMNHPMNYPNYPAASCSYPRNPTINPRYSHTERSMSPTRRGYPEHMNHLSYHNMPQKMPGGHNYPPQYAGGPEYAQHYQHRRLGQDCYPQSLRPAQYMQNHHQIPAQEMQELPENRISPSDSLKKFIENWAADEEPSSDINAMETNMNLRENMKVRDDAPPGTVYMINATDVQYFENNGIPIVTSDNGGIQLTSENYQYLLKNGLVDNTGMVRIIEANKEVSMDASGNHERIVNLQIMETSKSDCMMVSKALRPNEGSVGSSGVLPKADDESRKVIIHQNTVISPRNDSVPPQSQAIAPDPVVESISISKELVDKNCSPINLDQLDHNLDFSEPETESDKNRNNSISVSTLDFNKADGSKASSCKSNEVSVSEDVSQNSDDSQNKSPESKSMPIIDLFGEANMEESDKQKNDKDDMLPDQNMEDPSDTTDLSVSEETSSKENAEEHTNDAADETTLHLASSPKKPTSNNTMESTSLPNSVIVSPECIQKEDPLTEGPKSLSKQVTIETTSDKDVDGTNTSEATHSNDFKKQVPEDSPLLKEVKQSELLLEKTDNGPKTTDECKTLVGSPTVGRRKRIFSVDNIIHHIGNNLIRGSRELEPFCSIGTLTTFIAEEIEFSSLEQTLNRLQRNSGKITQEKDIQSIKNIDIYEPKSEESAEIISYADTTNENTKEASAIECDEPLETKDTKISVPTEIINDEKEETVHTTCPSATVPAVLQPDERSSTPNVFQYQNAIRVEEPSVLLQISGELMEISVNIVNGKKVITVVPLSETTVVDYNDNYEVSAVTQDTAVIAMEEGEVETEKIEISDNPIDDKMEETPSNQEKKNCALLKNQNESKFIEGDQEKQDPELVKEEIEGNDSITTKERIDVEVKGVNALQEKREVGAEEEPIKVNFIDTESFTNLDTVKADQETESETLGTEAQIDHTGEALDHTFETKSKEQWPEMADTNNPEACDLPKVSEVVEPKEINVEEVINSIDDSIIVESCESTKTPETFQIPETPSVEEPINTEEILASSPDDKQILYSPKTDACESHHINNKENAHDIDEDLSLKADYLELHDNSEIINEDCTDDVTVEDLDYQLEDDVFISEEPAHEIIISDPLEGVALIEEVDKTYDSFDVPLEPVSASDEVVEASTCLAEEGLDNDKIELGSCDHNEESGKKMDDKDTSEESEKLKPALPKQQDILNSPAHDIKEINPNISSVVETTPVKTARNKKIITRKSEVQILSPTSTNIDDHITTSKENVYLEPRRRSNSDNNFERISVAVTTKAAKKLYECDLQIPAVTTSGDVSPRVFKKLIKDQHDTVSSSKKEKVLKDLPKIKKCTLKRSKRINEKTKIKNEQKELLRLLAEKRRKRQELKKIRPIKNTEENKKVQDASNKTNATKDVNQKHSMDKDEEYVDFKELLRARKLKKLKKMQDVIPKESKEDTNMDEAPKSVAKEVNKIVSNKKVGNVNKSIVGGYNKHIQESKTEPQTTCCIGCKSSIKKSEKDHRQKPKKRKTSSDAKNDEAKAPINNKDLPLPVMDIKKSAPVVAEAKSIINNDLPVETKSNISETTLKLDTADEKSDKTTEPPVEVVPEKPLQNTATIQEGVVATQVLTADTKTEQDHVSKKVKLQKRVSFCDDIPSSTSSNDICGVPAEDIAFLKMKTRPASTLKDPRRRSQGHTGQIMVPSVSELIEENSGLGHKKKITLADYVNRKRKTSTENCDKTKSEDREVMDKKAKYDTSVHEIEEVERKPASYKPEEDNRCPKKTLKDVKTSFVIHSSDWEDSRSPISTPVQSNEECLIENFSGLIKNKSKRPVIDVNELTPLENFDNPKDKKLQEYKDKVDYELSSLNINIPKIKSNNRFKLDLDPWGSPESSTLIKKFLSDGKITQSEMEKIKQIISYKRLMQHQKVSRSPSKSPASATSAYSQSPACSTYEPTCFGARSPVNSGTAYSDSLLDPAYEARSHRKPETNTKKMRLHLKKVNAKRKLQLDSDDESSSSVPSNHSEDRQKKTVDYSVINRLGKDGLPKIIFKRNRTNDNSQLVVELERIDDNWGLVEEKYNVTVTQLV